AAIIAVITLEIKPRMITNKAINNRKGIALLTVNTVSSMGFLNHLNNRPATSTAIVILIGCVNASFNNSILKTWLTITDAIPIINKNTSKFRSTNLVNGNISTRNKIIIKPVIITTYFLF